MQIKLTVDSIKRHLTHIDYEYFWAVDPDRLKIRELSSNARKKTKMRSDNWFKDPTKIVEIIKPDLYDTNLRPSQAPKIRPTKYILGGLFNIELDATYGDNDDFFFDWFIKGRVIDGYFEVFHNKNEAPIKIEFWDCFIADYEEHMTQGSQAHKIKLRLSPAITRNRKYVLHEKVWKTTDIHQPEETTIYHRREEESTSNVDLKFIATFKRQSGYKGEFGFDWMRESYKSGGAAQCTEYSKFKEEYHPTIINDKEYFPPWLSMFPNQGNVQLDLSIDIEEGTAKDDDIIKLPPKKGIRFEPSELKVSEANGQIITVICDKPITNDISIELLDKSDKTVGKINILKNANHDQLHFNITPVRILSKINPVADRSVIESRIDVDIHRTKPDGTDRHIKGFGDSSTNLSGDLKNLEDYLNSEALNQALLQCTIKPVIDIIIDMTDWQNRGFINTSGEFIRSENIDILAEVNKEFKKQHPIQARERGLVMFLSSIDKEVKIQGSDRFRTFGTGELKEIDAKRFIIYKSGLYRKETIAHEMGHVLGLTHSFQENIDLDKVNTYNNFINKTKAHYESLRNRGVSESVIKQQWTLSEDFHRRSSVALQIYYRNPYTFIKDKTENIMDYSQVRLSFWKYQWETMQEDVIKFYSDK